MPFFKAGRAQVLLALFISFRVMRITYTLRLRKFTLTGTFLLCELLLNLSPNTSASCSNCLAKRSWVIMILGLTPKCSTESRWEIGQLIGIGVQVGLVIGGGNFPRSALQEAGMDRGDGDHMGMLATVMKRIGDARCAGAFQYLDAGHVGDSRGWGR